MNLPSSIGSLIRRCTSRPALAWTLSAVTFIVVFTQYWPNFTDLAVYYEAGSKAFHHRTVYDVVGHYQFKYSPAIALVFGFLFAPFSFRWASIVYYVLALASWIWLLAVIGRRSWERYRPTELLQRPQAAALVLFFVAFYSRGVRDELKLGQVNVVPLALLFFFFAGLDRPSRSIASLAWLGALLSLGIDIKLYCVLAVPVLLLRREWGVLVSTALQLLAVNLLGVAAWSGLGFAYREQIAWYRSLFASSAGLAWSEFNVSLLGIIGKISGLPALAVALWLVAVVCLGVILFLVRKHPPLHQLPLLLGAIAVLNPLSWPYWMLLTAPALLWLALRFDDFEERVQRRFLLAVPVLLALSHTQDSKLGTWFGTFAFNLAITGCFAWFALLRTSVAPQPEPIESAPGAVPAEGRGLSDLAGT